MHKINFSLRILVTLFAIAVLLQLTTSCAQKQVRQDTKASRSTENLEFFVQMGQGAKMLPSDEKPEIFVQIGQDGVDALDISQDGKYLISGSFKSAKLWDIAAGREIRTFKNKKGIEFLSFIPGDKTFLSLDSSGNVCIWDITTGNIINKFNMKRMIGTFGSISYDGNYLRIVDGPFLTVADVNRGVVTKTIRCIESGPATAYAFWFGRTQAITPDGKLVLSSAHAPSEELEKLLLLFDPLTGEIIHKFPGHKDLIDVIAISPDGSKALSGSRDKTVKFWDLKKGKEIATFRGHQNGIRVIAFSPDGRYALSGDGSYDTPTDAGYVCDSAVKLWDLKKRKNLHTFSQTSPIESVKFSSDGRLAFAGVYGAGIKIWDTSNGEEIRELKGDATTNIAMALSPDGRYLVTGSYRDKQLRYWDISSGKLIRSMPGHKGIVSSACFSPNGRHVVSGSSDRTIRLWDLTNGESVKTFSGHTGRVSSVTVSPDGKYILSYSKDKSVRLWDIAKGTEIKAFTMPDSIEHAGFSADGQSIIVAYDSKFDDIKVFDRKGKEAAFYKNVLPARYSTDGRYFLAEKYEKQENEENKIFAPETKKSKKMLSKSIDEMLVDIVSGEKLGNFKGSGSVVYISVAVDRDLILTRSYFDQESRLVKASTGKEIRRFPLKFGLLTPDGTKILSPSGKTLKLFDVETGNVLLTFNESASGEISSFGLSAKGGYAISGDSSGEIQFWDISSAKLIKRITGYKDTYIRRPVVSVAFSPDNRYAASLGGFGELKIWDLKSGNEVASIKTGGIPRYCDEFEAGNYIDYGRGLSEFSPNGRYIALGSTLYESSTGRKTLKFEFPYPGNYVAFSPDGRHLISGSHVWDVSTGKLINSYDFGEEVICLYSPDGKYIYAGGASIQSNKNGSFYVIESESGKLVRKCRDSMDPMAFDLSSDKKLLLVSSSKNTELSVWDVNSGKKINSFPTQESSSKVFFTPNNRYAVTNNGVSATIWDISTGKEIARFISFTDGEWIVITPEGYFNASPNGAKHLNVRLGKKVYSTDNFYERFFDPVYVASVLQGKKVEAVADIRKGFAMPPDVKITSPEPNATFNADIITITVSAKDTGGGIDEIRLYHNSKAIGEDQRAVKIVPKGNEVTKTYTVTLVDGLNNFRAVGFSRDRTESNPYELIVKLTAPSKDVSLYVFAVGINKYKNPALNLNYAEPDARGIVDFFKQKGSGLFKNVALVEIYNEQATKQGITSKLKQLQNTQPQDAVLIYFAGHGESVGDKWYFIPHEITYPEREEEVKAKGISSEELAVHIKDIKAQKILMLIDACKSGAVMIAFRGFEDRKALSQLSRSTGVHIIAASTKDQFAAEVKELGHGVFTYTLLEGLKGKALGRGETVTVRKLMGYVEEQLPDITKKYKQEAQYPVVDSRGMDFPLVIVK